MTVTPRRSGLLATFRGTCKRPAAARCRYAGADGRRVHLHHVPPPAGPPSRTRWCSTTSPCPSSRAPRSACSARTAPASRRCCGSWPGVDKDFSGEAVLAPGRHASATCRRSRALDATKDVRGNVEEGGRARSRTCCAASRRSARGSASIDADEMEKLARRAGELQDEIDAANAWDLDRTLEIAMDALRVPPGDADVDHALRRRAPPRRALPAAAADARHAAARRADQPPRRRVGGLARAPPEEYPGTVVAVTHDRYFLDNVAGWILELDRGDGIPWKGNYSSWLEQKQQRLAAGGEGRVGAPAGTLARELEWVRSSPRARQAKSKARLAALRAAARRGGAEARRRRSRSASRRARAWATWSSRPTASRKGYGDRLLIEDLSFTLPPGGIVGVIGPTAPARPRSSA